MKVKKTKYGDYATWIYFKVLANYTIRLVFTNDLAASAKERIGSSPEGSFEAFCYHVKDKGMSYIFLPMDVTESTVAHESWHIVNRMMRFIDVQDLDDEMVAYHLDHLVEAIYEFKNKIQLTEKEHDQKHRGTGSKKRS